MPSETWSETMVEQKVTYTLEVDGKFIIIGDYSGKEPGRKYKYNSDKKQTLI